MGQFLTNFTAKIHASLDAAGIVNAIDREQITAAKVAGAKIRRKARDLLRRRKKPSPAGQPPSHHATDQRYSLKFITYAWDPATRALVIGPHLTRPSRLAGATVPQMQEFGGSFLVRQMRRPHLAGLQAAKGLARDPAAWQPFRLRAFKNDSRHNLPIETRQHRVNYPARPWMIRALESEQQAIPEAWRGRLGGT